MARQRQTSGAKTAKTAPRDAPPQLSEEAKADLTHDLQTKVADRELRTRVTARLDPILRDYPPDWENEDKWRRYVDGARDPSPDELVPFLAGLACRGRAGHIANSMARRAKRWDADRHHYGKPPAKALLDENCEGTKALTDETRAELRELVSAAE